MFKTFLIWAFLFFCTGDVLGIFRANFPSLVPAAAGCLAAALAVSFRLRERLLPLFLLLALAGGFLLGTSDEPVRTAWQDLYGRTVTLEGEWEPASLQVREGGVSGVLDVRSPLSGKIRIFIQNGRLEERPLRVRGRLQEQTFHYNPGGINGPLMARIRGIYGRMTVPAGGAEYRAGPLSLRKRVDGAVLRWKRQLMERLHRPESALLPGMVLGGYDGVRTEDADVMRDNGLAHLMAVSGTHVALLTAFLLLLTRRWQGPSKHICLAAVLVLYAAACGLRPAVLRAVLLCLVLLWGRQRGLTADPLRLLLLVAWALLLVCPLWLVDLSFQLSFVTVAGLILLGPVVQERLPGLLSAWLRAVLAVTLTAQLVTVPFLVFYFHRLVPLSLVSNLLLVPALEAAVLLFLPSLFLAPLLPSLAAAAAWPAEFLLAGVLQTGALLARLPGAAVTVGDWGLWRSLLYYGLLALWSDRGPMLQWSSRRRRCCLTVLLVLFLLPACRGIWQSRPLEVHFMDVGQGDAALVRAPDGKTVLIDTGGTRGGYDTGRQIVVPYLRYLGIDKLDALILSHGDFDHIGGARTVLASLPVGHLFLGQGEDTPELASLLRQAPAALPVTRLRRGEQWRIGRTAFTVAAAGGGEDIVHTVDATQTNRDSLILQLRAGKHSLVFPGDADLDTEEASLPWLGPCDLLKVGHHGSKTSSSDHFLHRLAPRAAVISSGRGNKYGHPAPELLERLWEHGIRPLRTDQLGAIRVVFDDSGLQWYSYKYQKDRFIP
ncbi:MAG: DNA internalization-related competence protein ComEC/Rec2 [Succiniclasticum sp.]|nr:DNA internalization-related competence protein ComEC/Rec2 [Succiniclasticum sp.]